MSALFEVFVLNKKTNEVRTRQTFVTDSAGAAEKLALAGLNEKDFLTLTQKIGDLTAPPKKGK